MNIRRLVITAIGLVGVATLGAFSARVTLAQSASAPFSFMAFGDMPYSLPDENILKIKDYFNTLEQPLIFTPGDNEWTDCHRDAAGKFNPLERLEFVRKSFFASNKSLGKNPMTLERQADVSEFKQMVENTRWTMNNVMFATLHVIGSNNGFERNLDSVGEFFARDNANVAWIKDTFAKAKAAGNAGVVFGFQADMFFTSTAVYSLPGNAGDNAYAKSGFAKTLTTLAAESAAFAKPVLLVHGDSHVLVIDQPLVDAKGALLENVTRLEVMGAAGRVHAVEVMVNPNDTGVFSFRPMWVKENFPAAK
jgi:hypothetical protein